MTDIIADKTKQDFEDQLAGFYNLDRDSESVQEHLDMAEFYVKEGRCTWSWLCQDLAEVASLYA
jgi:hypothetical protein